MVAIGNRILKIDAMKVGKGETFSAEEPLKCSIDKLIDGVQLVGKHDGDVTELSMCQWMKSRLASASADGTVCISTPCLVILLCVPVFHVFYLGGGGHKFIYFAYSKKKNIVEWSI